MTDYQTFYFDGFKVKSKFVSNGVKHEVEMHFYKRILFLFWKFKTIVIYDLSDYDKRSLFEHSNDCIKLVSK